MRLTFEHFQSLSASFSWSTKSKPFKDRGAHEHELEAGLLGGAAWKMHKKMFPGKKQPLQTSHFWEMETLETQRAELEKFLLGKEEKKIFSNWVALSLSLSEATRGGFFL